MSRSPSTGRGRRSQPGTAVDVYFKKPESYTGNMTIILKFKKYRSHRNYTKLCQNRP